MIRFAALCFTCAIALAPASARADTVLDDDDRRAFLWYYAPIILKVACLLYTSPSPRDPE